MLANIGLRGVAAAPDAVGEVDWSIWVSANKALPVTLAAWAVVTWRAMQGLPALPPVRMVLPLILTGLFMQWGGNVGFQFALSRAGLALTVPLTFSTILVSSAIVGRLALADPLSPSTVLAMGVMTAAIVVLTQGTEAAAGAMMPEANFSSTALAVAAACLAGVAYGSGGVMIRRCVRGELSHSATIMVLSTTGIVTLGGASLLRMGPHQLWATTPVQWLQMLGAGIATAVAFFALSAAYQRVSAVKANLLNASQAAMAALTGVVLFGEPNTGWLHAGTALTILGLVLSARSDAPRRRLHERRQTPVPAAASSTSANVE